MRMRFLAESLAYMKIIVHFGMGKAELVVADSSGAKGFQRTKLFTQ